MAMKKSDYRYSVRGLLVFVAVVALFLGTLTNRAKRQQHAVQAIEADYGRVMYDFQETRKDYFDTRARNNAPAWLISALGVDYFNSVVLVDLDSPKVTNSTLDHLSALPGLKTLHISNASISSDGLGKLKGLNSLQTLTLNTDGIDDSALKYISKLPSLKTLELHGAHISDQGCLPLRVMAQLEILWLNETDVSEQGIEKLRDALPRCKIDG
jgi:hypothetical protein